METIASSRHSERPLFSVIIPTFNRSSSILDSLASVWAQDLADLEVIVVDDGSTDDTVARLDQVGDPRLRVIRQANRGASAARNVGIDAARGAYVAFLDSDDFYLPHHLSGLLAVLGRPGVQAAYTQVIAERGHDRRILKPARGLRAGERMADYLLRDRGFIQTSGLALAREVAAAVRYREDVPFGDDTDFAIRLQLAGCQFGMVDVPSVLWMDTPRDDRLSYVRKVKLDVTWLRDLRRDIPDRAYYGYLGWHVAKSVRPQSAWQALRLYLQAVVHGAFTPRLAIIIFLQIFLSDRQYRLLADGWIRFLMISRGARHAETHLPDDSGGARGRMGR